MALKISNWLICERLLGNRDFHEKQTSGTLFPAIYIDTSFYPPFEPFLFEERRRLAFVLPDQCHSVRNLRRLLCVTQLWGNVLTKVL